MSNNSNLGVLFLDVPQTFPRYLMADSKTSSDTGFQLFVKQYAGNGTISVDVHNRTTVGELYDLVAASPSWLGTVKSHEITLVAKLKPLLDLNVTMKDILLSDMSTVFVLHAHRTTKATEDNLPSVVSPPHLPMAQFFLVITELESASAFHVPTPFIPNPAPFVVNPFPRYFSPVDMSLVTPLETHPPTIFDKYILHPVFTAP